MKSIMGSLSQHEEVQRRADRQEHDQGKHEILLDSTGLNDAQFAAKPVGGISRAIANEAIDDRQVELIADSIANALRAGSEQMQDAIDQPLIQQLVDDILGEPVDRLDKDPVIKFVKVIFVLQEVDLES